MMRLWLLITPLIAGCSSSSPPTPTVPAQAAASSAAPSVTPQELTAPVGHLTLGSVTLQQHGKPGLLLRENGAVEVPGGKTLGRLGVDGRLVSPEGKLVAHLTEDGEIMMPNGDYLPVVVEESGEVRLLKENRTIRLLEDGRLEGVNEGAGVTIDGVTPQTRRAALFLLVLAAYPARSL